MAVLQQGSSGPDVKALQTQEELGFDPTGTNGNFGPGTKAAVIAFQQSKGLTADGKDGPDTMAALQSAGGAVSVGVDDSVNVGSSSVANATPSSPAAAKASQWRPAACRS